MQVTRRHYREIALFPRDFPTFLIESVAFSRFELLTMYPTGVAVATGGAAAAAASSFMSAPVVATQLETGSTAQATRSPSGSPIRLAHRSASPGPPSVVTGTVVTAGGGGGGGGGSSASSRCTVLHMFVK
jgi:hypothetical protein